MQQLQSIMGAQQHWVCLIGVLRAASRYWAMVEKHRITQFYTAPTAIRALMRFGDEPVLKHDRSSLRILGSVGEPINPEAWRW